MSETHYVYDGLVPVADGGPANADISWSKHSFRHGLQSVCPKASPVCCHLLVPTHTPEVQLHKHHTCQLLQLCKRDLLAGLLSITCLPRSTLAPTKGPNEAHFMWRLYRWALPLMAQAFHAFCLKEAC